MGDGILRAAAQQQIAEAGLTDHFHFTGLVSPERIAPLIGAMDVLVHASLREGLARALAAGADRRQTGHQLRRGRGPGSRHPDETGYLLAPRSVEPLADAIVDLAQDAGTATAAWRRQDASGSPINSVTKR